MRLKKSCNHCLQINKKKKAVKKFQIGRSRQSLPYVSLDGAHTHIETNLSVSRPRCATHPHLYTKEKNNEKFNHFIGEYYVNENKMCSILLIIQQLKQMVFQSHNADNITMMKI